METNIIAHRRREVEAEIGRYKTLIAELETELVDLETAERVFARLTGARRIETGASDRPKPQGVPGQAAHEPPLTEKIQTVLREAQRGMKSSEIFAAIIQKGWSASKDNVRTTTWRLWNEDRISKTEDGSALYSVPEREEGADLLSHEDQSAPLSQPSAQGGEPDREVEHDNIG